MCEHESSVKRLIPSAALLGVAALLSFFAFYAEVRASSATSTYNWAGYAATGASYSAVAGSWRVPAMAYSASTTASGEWVGIGGFGSSDLIQAGTRAISEAGRVRYEAWYELLPTDAVVVPLAVAPGDVVSASVAEISTDAWHISLADETTGATFSTTVSYHSALGSAEWVLEAPKGLADYLPLGAVEPVAFSNAYASVNGQSLPAELAGSRALTLIAKGGAELASPTLWSAPDAFTAARD